MSVETTHPLYTEFSPLWELCRDSIAGQQKIKSRREAYLPRPSGANDDKYNAYLMRAVYSSFTTRTADGLYGQVFSKEPVIEGNDTELGEALIKNVDGKGTSLVKFASELVWDTLPTHRSLILVDYSAAREGMDILEVKREGLRPVMIWYSAENITNWAYDIVNDKKTLVMVVLKEGYSVQGKDEFTPVSKTRYRVLKMKDVPEKGFIYVQEIWEKSEDDKKEWYKANEIKPEMQGKNLDFIPVFMLPADEPEESMLLPIAHLNIGHYQLMADYRNIIHLTCTPTMFGINVRLPLDPTDEKKEKLATIKMGGDVFNAIESTNEHTPSIFYLESTGTGASSSIVAIEDTKKDIEIMGGDLIKPQKKGVETAEAARIHKSNEISILGAFILSVSEEVTKAVRLALKWYGVAETEADKFEIKLNMDYEGELSLEGRIRQDSLLVDSDLMSTRRFLTQTLSMTDEEAEAEMAQIDKEKRGVFAEEPEEPLEEPPVNEGEE